MAHTRVSIKARTQSASNPITTAITVPVGCTVMVVLMNVIAGSVRTGALTWGEFTLSTPAQSPQIDVTAPEASAELWYLLNPPTGVSKTLTIPNGFARTIFYTVEGGSAAAGGTSAFDASNGGHATAVNPTPGAITITEAGEAVWAIAAGGWTTWAPSAQVGTIIANTDDGATGGGEQYALNPAIGSFTLSWTFGTSDDWGSVVAAFKEVPPQVLQDYMGVDCASAGVISVGEKIR